MPSVSCFSIRFTPSWLMLTLAGLAFSLFMQLGFWQVHRALEKENRINRMSKMNKAAPQMWSRHNTLPELYQHLFLKGYYLPAVYLLDNQLHAGHFGYDVVSPWAVDEKHVVLVDRGWIEADSTRAKLPFVTHPTGVGQIEGYAYYPQKKPWFVRGVMDKTEGEYTVIEYIDTKFISQLLHKSVYPFIIRLGQAESNGFLREWPVVSMKPERHKAYALQWFTMAFVVLILLFALNTKKKI